MSPAEAGPPIATVNPATGELLQSFEPYDAAGVERRLATAAATVPVWARSSFDDRSRLLVTVAELLEGELPDIAHVVTTEMGKPFAQAKGEVGKCASGLRWFAEHAEAMLTDREVPVDASLGLITFQPLGAVLAIMPWNFPLWQVFRFAAPAVMAGNVGLLKHAPGVPRTALLLEDLFRRAGAPDGVFQTLLIGTDQVPAVIADPRVAAVTLTGSVGAGRAVAALAGAARAAGPVEAGTIQPTNWNAILIFAAFVLLTLGITYWAARRTRSAIAPTARYEVEPEPTPITSPSFTWSASRRATSSFSARFEIGPDQSKRAAVSHFMLFPASSRLLLQIKSV